MVSPAASLKTNGISLQPRGNRSNSLNPSICEDGDTFLVGTRLIAVIIGLSCCVFCTSLDNTIVATAIPKIAADFQSVEDVGWYASSYLLTTCAVTLPFGRMYTYFTVKWVYLGALLIFELGSLICATAPSSVAFIVGRAIAGLGGGGLFSGSLVIISQCVPVRRRPAFSGLIMGMFAVASVIAPLLGGAFTDHLTWRWCFYINLPLGAITAVTIFATFERRDPIVRATRREKLSGLDPIGTLVFLPAVICLLLALQWGGTVYPWKNGRVIGLLVTFGLLFACFICLQVHAGEKAMLPPRLLQNRNIWGSAIFSFCMNSAMFIYVYYLPIWFQAVKGVTATKSGLMNLPFILSNILLTMTSGIAVTMLRYYSPFMLLSAIMACISTGLLTTFSPSVGPAKWIGYQIFLGTAIGVGFQLPIFVVQTTLSATDIPTATALMTFVPLMGGSVFVSVAQNLFQSRLIGGLRTHVPELDTAAVLATGPTGLRAVYEGTTLHKLLDVYNGAVVGTFYPTIALAAVSLFAAMVIQWRPLNLSRN